MLPRIFSKLSSLKNRRNLSILSSCKQPRLQKNEDRKRSNRSRSHHKRLYSIASPRSENGLARDNVDEEKTPKKYQSKKVTTAPPSNNNRPFSTKGSRNVNVVDEEQERNKYQEYYDTPKQEKYELEAARPRRRTDQLFNVFEFVRKEIDLNEYLQPNNLKPFGSHDNFYMPILMSNKNSCLVHTNPSYLPPEQELLIKNHENQSANQVLVEESFDENK